MQLLQQAERETKSTNTVENIQPAPSYEDDSWPKSLEYSEELKEVIEKKAKYNVKNKNSTRSLIDLADIHYARNSYGKANEYYLKSLKQTNNSVHVLRKIIQLNTDRKDIDTADRFYGVLLDKSTNHNDILNYLNFLLTNYQFISNSQLDVFEKYSDDYPKNPDFKNLYGVALIRRGELDKSYKVFSKLKNDNPKYIHGFNNLGVVNLMLGDLKSSQALFKDAIKIDRYFVYAYQNLASSYLTSENEAEALKVLKDAFNLDLNLEDKWIGNLAQLLTDIENDQTSAIKLHRRLLESYPEHPVFLNNLGVNYKRLKKIDKAHHYYRLAAQNITKVSTLKPEKQYQGVIMTNLLETQINLGLKKEATAQAEKILKIFPDNVPALSYSVRTAMDERQFDKARELSERAYKLDKLQPEIVLNLSYIYSVFDLDNKHAYDVLNDFIKSGISSRLSDWMRDLIFNNLAYNLIKLGKLSESKKYLDKIKEFPTFVATSALYALYSGDVNKAKRLFEKSFKMFEDPFNRDMNILFSNYELAQYYFDNNKMEKALSYTEDGLRFNINKQMRMRLNNLHRLVLKQINIDK